MNVPANLEWEDDENVTLPGLPGARILVADDDEAMRSLVSSELASEGFMVSEAVSGTDLLLSLDTANEDAASGVDLIVLDFRMPGMSGLEVLRLLRAAHWGTPAILMTAFADPKVIAEAGRLGVPVLSKPFPLETLTRVAISLLVEQEKASSKDSSKKPVQTS